MDFQKCIETRRSIRKYKAEPVDRKVIGQLVQAAILAPSWKNSQVTRFYAADGEKRQQLAECLPSYNQNNTKDAAVLIVVTVKDKISGFDNEGNSMTKLGDGFQYFDSALQVENLCLKAHELGLGTLIMGLYDEEKTRAFLGINESEKIVCFLSVGVPNIEPKMPNRNSVDDVLKFI